MRITAFLHAENSEPMDISEDLDLDTGLGEDDDPYTLREVLEDVANLHADTIDVVSENAITIALHALHGVAKTADGEPLAWALAGLRELAFYDMDGLETVDDPEGADAGLLDQVAADPGREAVDKIRCGTHLTTGTDYYVQWPVESGGAS